MPKVAQKRSAQTQLSDFDKLVLGELKKSVVNAPSNPNGGTSLPKRQKNAANRKGKSGTQYMAVFDREDAESNDQLEDWEDETNDATDSPEDFVNDDEDGDGDDGWEDSRGDEVYDPLSDDDDLDEGDLESLDLPEDTEEYVKVKGHKRRKVKKSNVADDDEGEEDDFPDMSDDDDLDEGGDEEEDEKPRKSAKKDDEKKNVRRKQVRKALGADAMKFVDGNEFVKSLTEAIFDMRDDFIAEVRSLRSENRELKKSLSGLKTLVQTENRQLTKSLVTAQMQIAGYQPQEEVAPQQRGQAQPIRKGYGASPVTSQRPVERNFDLAKSLDALDEAFRTGVEGIRSLDATILENDKVPDNLSPAAQRYLQKANLL